jgi:hypothetical protein
MAMNPKLLRPKASGFNPKSISNLAIWLDASDTASLTFNGSTVSEWRDLSGNDRHFAQATAANQPGTSTMNGRRTLTSAGSAYMTGNAATLGVARNVGGLTMIVVGTETNTSGGATYTMISFTVASSAGARAALVRVSSTANYQFAAGGRRLDADSFALAGSAASQSAAATVLAGTFDYANSDAFLHKDGSLAGSNTTFQTNGNTTDANSQGVGLFASPTGTNGMSGSIAEVLVYQRALTSAERQRIERAFGKKWGITVA